MFDRFSKGWNQFFFATGDPSTCSVLRIGFALLSLINLGFLFPDRMLWFGESGVLPYAASRTAIEFSSQWTLFGFFPKNDTTITVCFAILAFHLAALLAGWKSRFQAAAVFVWLISFQHRNPLILDAADSLFRLLSFFLILMPIGERWSIDSLLRRGSGNRSSRSQLWGLQLVRIQVTLVYFSAAIYKLQSNDWLSGHALYYVFQLAEFQHLPIPEFFLESLSLQKWATWSVMGIELLLPFLLWIPRTRKLGIGLGIALHLAIQYAMFLFLFQWIMILLVCSFWKGEEIRSAETFIREKAGRRFQPT